MGATEDSILKNAYAECAKLVRERAKNFYWGFLTLPKEKRQAIYAVYAFCRTLDDITDSDEPYKIQRLYEQRLRLEACYESAATLEDPSLLALRDTIRRHRIPKEYFEEVLRGVEMDLHLIRYESFEELKIYCHRVAAAVGLICLEIFGYCDKSAQKHAVDLGIAMQLTNILRDTPEDLERGRIYIPQEDLRRFGYGEDDLKRGVVNEAFRALMRYEIERARGYFRSGRLLLKFLPLGSRACPAVLSRIYERILDGIEAQGYDVFRRRVSLSLNELLLSLCEGWARSLMFW